MLPALAGLNGHLWVDFGTFGQRGAAGAQVALCGSRPDRMRMDEGVRNELIAVARRRQTRRLVIGAVVLPVFMMAAEGIGFLLARRDHPDRPHHHLLLVVILLTFPIVLVLIEFGVFLLLRRRGVGWLQPSPLMGTDRRRRKRIVRALRRGEHLDADDEELALDTARRWHRVAKVQLGIGLVFLINLVLQVLAQRWVLASLTALACALVVTQFWLLDYRARHYLAGTPYSTTVKYLQLM